MVMAPSVLVVFPRSGCDTQEGLIKHWILLRKFQSPRPTLPLPAICSPVKSLNFNATFPALWDRSALAQGQHFLEHTICRHAETHACQHIAVMHDSLVRCCIGDYPRLSRVRAARRSYWSKPEREAIWDFPFVMKNTRGDFHRCHFSICCI